MRRKLSKNMTVYLIHIGHNMKQQKQPIEFVVPHHDRYATTPNSTGYVKMNHEKKIPSGAWVECSYLYRPRVRLRKYEYLVRSKNKEDGRMVW